MHVFYLGIFSTKKGCSFFERSFIEMFIVTTCVIIYLWK